MSKFAIAAACFSAMLFAQPSAACSLPEYADNGQYVGGDLVEQIATKAHTIKIVRVSARHLAYRTYSEGQWYLQFGNIDVPSNRPEYIDQFVYELSVVETLKGGPNSNADYYENSPRVLAYGATDLRALAFNGSATAHFNELPDWLLTQPGHDGLAFTGGAAEGVGLGLGECNTAYLLDVGQTLIALRDSMGRLYPSSGAFPLEINAEFRSGSRRRERVSFNMQSLVPVESNEGAFVTSLREALRRQN